MLQISQPTFSRLVLKVGNEITRLGKARSSIYAIKKDIKSLGSNFPVYLITPTGEAEHLGDLVAVKPSGYFFYSKNKSIHYQDLPYWLNDCRPSGFLGRLITKNKPDLGYPKDIRFWSNNDCLHYWTTLGNDLIGNLVIGEKTILNLKTLNESSNKNLNTYYEECTKRILEQGSAGSSAGGEQPKFLSINPNTKSQVLVKFSPPLDSAVGKRRSELLILENLALSTLNENGISASNSNLFFISNRTYLELDRFDRLKNGGRKGLISLHTLDLEFCGSLGTWRDIALALLNKNIITQNIFDQILQRYYFGLCIANNDMHSWNLSFFISGETIEELAPVYDMLPMAFAPINEELVQYRFNRPVLLPNEESKWRTIIPIAIEFWAKVLENKKFSKEIKEAARVWKGHLEKI